jgi:hypothetical protein
VERAFPKNYRAMDCLNDLSIFLSSTIPANWKSVYLLSLPRSLWAPRLFRIEDVRIGSAVQNRPGRCNMGASSFDVERSGDTVITNDKGPDQEKLLDWNDPCEKRNPKNWSMPSRIFHTTLPSFLAFEM